MPLSTTLIVFGAWILLALLALTVRGGDDGGADSAPRGSAGRAGDSGPRGAGASSPGGDR